ncbi:MAG: hypothetical protein H7A25_25255 [Leptospiraceae bacterium]|nr:hypothetical protein [Leptospiraceae bacterium]MCP5503230.1 hypothetical protein [Leptospiraceae bacterium]
MKNQMTPESAIAAFIQSEKEGTELPSTALESIQNYQNWGEVALKGLLNTSAYYPKILLEEDMERKIIQLLEGFKARQVERQITY